MALVKIYLKAKGKVPDLPSEMTLPAGQALFHLIEALSKETGVKANQIRLTTKSDKPVGDSRSKDVVLVDGQPLGNFATNGELTVYVRDLGPQIAWRTVFLIEYLGPLLIHPIFYFGQSIFYGQLFRPALNQQLTFILVLLHFFKREVETAGVHKFSNATMPLFNLFKNCTHYWLLSGVFVAYFTYAPASWGQGSWVKQLLFGHNFFEWDTNQLTLLVLAWVFAEGSNYAVHLNLASMRPTGSTERKIPFGYGFRKVSCPNYFFEALSWFIVSLLAQNWSVWLFFLVGALQMYFWAVKKHKRYLKEFPNYPKDRTAFIPYVC